MKFAKTRSTFFKAHLSLNIQNNTHNLIPSHQDFTHWIRTALQGKYRTIQVGILLCDNDEAREYNHHYRQKDYATNVLSFPLDTPEFFHQHTGRCLFGDLIFCPHVVEKEALEQNKDLLTHYAHLTIHGILHLRGFDHIIDTEAKQMESLEISLMNSLGYNNPYQEG